MKLYYDYNQLHDVINSLKKEYDEQREIFYKSEESGSSIKHAAICSQINGLIDLQIRLIKLKPLHESEVQIEEKEN